MSESSTYFIPRILGISGSIFLSGYSFSASYYTLPAISLSPIPLRLQQWQVVYDEGKLVAPPLSAISALAWAWTAWTAKDSDAVKYYAAAAGLSAGFLFWTLGAMMSTNIELERRVKAAKEDGEKVLFREESGRLLESWTRMNYVRAALPMVGAWVGLYAALK